MDEAIETGDATIYPMEYATLKKGTVVPVEVCERILGIDRKDERYDLRLLGLAAQIEREAAAADNPILPRGRRKQIVILTDAQASAECRKDHDQHVRGIARALRRQTDIVNPALLTDAERNRHDHNVNVQSFMFQAMQRAKRKVLGKESQPIDNDADGMNYQLDRK